MRDETGSFGKLGYGSRTDSTGVVLHRTESPSMQSTRNAYTDRVNKGSNVGAHYLIGQEGETSLTVPTNKNVGHTRGNKDRSHRNDNRNTIGIENVGMASQLSRRGNLRAQVEGLNLPPEMRKRLLALSDSKLKQTMRDTQYLVHTDVTGPQKRANWNLVNALKDEHDFTLDDVYAHEQVDYKTLGEAEPLVEFFAARRRWPAMLQALRDKAENDPALKGVLAQEEATWAALQVDGTQAEKNAVDGEKILGEPGPAQEREADRAAFYDQFWSRYERLQKLIAE